MECTLSDEALGRRLEWIHREILPHVLETVRERGVLALELGAAPGLAETIDRWIELERECCAGLVFERRASATRGRLRLEIRGLDPAAADAILGGGAARGGRTRGDDDPTGPAEAGCGSCR